MLHYLKHSRRSLFTYVGLFSHICRSLFTFLAKIARAALCEAARVELMTCEQGRGPIRLLHLVEKVKVDSLLELYFHYFLIE